jgi:hypothetical protein
MQIDFGKHNGMEIEDLPGTYIWWLLGQDFVYYKPILLEHLQQEAITRWPERLPTRIIKEIVTEPARQVSIKSDVQGIFRKLAMKYHPDHGGNTLAMAALNEFRELITNVCEK